MTLGGLLRASLNSPSRPISSASISEFLGRGSGTLAGVVVSEQRALGLTAYYRGVTLLASTVAAMPLKVYRDGTRERVRQRTVLDNPNPAQTPFEFWQTFYANGVSWGNGYARKYYNRADVVSEVWNIHPSSCELRRVNPSPAVPDGKVFEVTDLDGRMVELTSRDVFHLPYMSPHGGAGVSPLRLARQVLGISIAAEDTSARFYGSGTMVSGIISTEQKLSTEQRKSLKDGWREKVAGASNVGDIAVLDAGARFVPLTIPPADAQLLESRRFGVTEIARLLGVPPFLLMDTEKSTSWGTGIEQQNIALRQYTLQGWLKAGEQRITRELLPGGWSSGSWFAEYDVEGLLRADSKSRAAFYHQAITDGWMNRNEIRALENLESAEGLDEFVMPSYLTMVTMDGQLVPLSSDGIGDTGGADVIDE